MELLKSLQLDGSITPVTTNVYNLGSPSLSWATIYAATDVKVGGFSVWTSGNDGSGSGLDADTLDGHDSTYFLVASNYTASDVLSKLLTVDGAASGLDADLLDGQQGSWYADIVSRLGYTPINKAGDTGIGALTLTGTLTVPGGVHVLGNATGAANDSAWVGFYDSANTVRTGYIGDSVSSTLDLWLYAEQGDLVIGSTLGSVVIPSTTNLSVGNNATIAATLDADVITATSAMTLAGSPVWTAANDGASSGLDADLLDGQQGSYYLDYTNFSNTPALATVATTGAYSDLTGTPSLSTVATSGAYSDLTGIPTSFTPSAHVLATTAGLGAEHTTSGLTAGQVLRATGATTAAFQSLIAADIPSLDAGKITTGTFGLARIPTITVPYGGTGLTSYTAGNYINAATGTTLQQRTPAQVLSDIGALASSSYTAADVLTKIKTVDGSGSGLDADLLDGQHGTYYLAYANLTGVPSSFTPSAHVLATTTGLGAEHTVSGLTSGQVLRATGATTAAFGSLVATDIPSLDASKITTGTLAVARLPTVTVGYGGTGLTSYTAGNYINAATTSTLQQRTPAQVLSDIGALASSSYTASDILTKIKTVDGSGSGLDADLLDAQTGSYYLAWANLTGVPSTFAPSAHVLATTTALGAEHTVSGLTAGQVLRATGATTAAFQSLIAADIPNLSTSILTSGTLGVARGGTGIASYTAGNYINASSTSALQQRTPAQVLSDIGALASSTYTASDILTKIKTVDGAGSGLDADLLDGQSSAYFLAWANLTGVPSTFTPSAHVLATTTGLGAEHTVSGLTSGQVLRATGATTAAFGSLIASDIPNLDAGKITTGTFNIARIPTITAVKGGTGLTSFTAGNYLNAASTTTIQQRTPAQVLSDIGALASSSYTAADVLTKIKTVDGNGSGLDADTLDAHDSTYFATSTHTHQSLVANSQSGGTNGVVRLSAANTWTAAANTDNTTALYDLMYLLSGVYYQPGSIITGLSGLTAGSVYWLGASSGTITTTIPTPSSSTTAITIGKSLSTTSLLFAPGTPKAVIAAPTGASVTVGNATATVTWTDSTYDGVMGVRLYRGTATGVYTPLATIAPGVQTYTDNTVTNGTTYYYALKAIDAYQNDSNYSSEVSVTPVLYAAILSDLAAQGTPADSTTRSWLDANYTGQPYAVLKDSTGSAGAKLGGSGTLLAWWGDGTSDSFTLTTGSDQDIGKSGVAASARGIILLGSPTRWVQSGAYGSAYVLTRLPTSLTYLYLFSTSVSGDLSVVSALTSLATLNLGVTSVSGDIAAVSALTSLTYLYLYYTSVSGDVGAVSALTSLTTLNLGLTSVSGDIAAVSALTSLATLYLNGTPVSGDIGAVSALTSLATMYLGDTSVSGDVGAVSALTSLTQLYLGGTSVSGATSPTINSAPHLGTCNISGDSLAQAAVDTILSDAVDSLSLSGRVTCTLDLSGNAAPSSAGLSDKSTLVSAGWTVTTA